MVEWVFKAFNARDAVNDVWWSRHAYIFIYIYPRARLKLYTCAAAKIPNAAVLCSITREEAFQKELMRWDFSTFDSLIYMRASG